MTWFVYRYTTSWRLWWWCSYWLLVYVAAGWTTLIDLGVVAAGQDNLNFNFLYFSLLMRTGLGPRPVPVCQLKLEARPCLCRTHTTPSPPARPTRNTVVTVSPVCSLLSLLSANDALGRLNRCKQRPPCCGLLLLLLMYQSSKSCFRTTSS